MWRVAVLLLLVAGCGRLAPAATPAQLAHTPGPPVIVTQTEYVSTAFALRYPGDWQVITHAAFAPPSVVLVHPTGTAVMIFSVEDFDEIPPPPNAAGPLQSERRRVTLADGTTIYAGMIAPAGAEPAPGWGEALALFEAALQSLRPSPG